MSLRSRPRGEYRQTSLSADRTVAKATLRKPRPRRQPEDLRTWQSAISRRCRQPHDQLLAVCLSSARKVTGICESQSIESRPSPFSPRERARVTLITTREFTNCHQATRAPLLCLLRLPLLPRLTCMPQVDKRTASADHAALA